MNHNITFILEVWYNNVSSVAESIIIIIIMCMADIEGKKQAAEGLQIQQERKAKDWKELTEMSPEKQLLDLHSNIAWQGGAERERLGYRDNGKEHEEVLTELKGGSGQVEMIGPKVCVDICLHVYVCAQIHIYAHVDKYTRE